MPGKEKLVNRLLTIPKDFTWEELTKVLNLFTFGEVKGGKTGEPEEGLLTKKRTL